METERYIHLPQKQPQFGPHDRIEVQLAANIPLNRLTYQLKEHQWADIGQIVWVPVGAQRLVGLVIGAGDNEFSGRLRSPTEIIAFLPPMRKEMVDFLRWMSDWTMTPLNKIFKLALSSPDALNPPKEQKQLVYNTQFDAKDLRQTNARKHVFDLVQQGDSWLPKELAEEAGVSLAVINTLEKTGALIPIAVESELKFNIASPKSEFQKVHLSAAQQMAADDLISAVQAHQFAPILLDGVPGSGKTEVYFEMIAEALKENKQILVMLPEIALSAQWLERFKTRFGVLPAIWHSELGAAQRRKTWQAVALEKAKVVVGARSALFLPFQNLGAIIVDEEHDGSYKQEEIVVYQGRDMAILRANKEHIPIVLSTATPSLETWVNYKEGRYSRLHLESRFGGQILPDIHLIDLEDNRPQRGQWISPILAEEIEANLATGEQTLLFLNRRGYAPLTLCYSCKSKIECPNCSTWLVEHRNRGRLLCHYCGFEQNIPKICPVCEKEDTLVSVGPGVERILEEVSERWPQARVSQASSDVLGSPQKAAELVAQIENKETDIIVGTQVISRGYHFPDLTLVGVIDADAALGGGDLRAAEHSWQLLWQVAGRAGRSTKEGRVYLQTHLPQNNVMRALVLHDRDLFMEREIKERKQIFMPPYGRLATLTLSDSDENRLYQVCRKFQKAIPTNEHIHVYGPATPPIEKIRNRFRMRFMVMGPKDMRLQPYIHLWLQQAALPSQTRMKIDIDPYNFM
ncbi:MAG: primosomal protein N' [Alphaproteobacteria bacterium]